MIAVIISCILVLISIIVLICDYSDFIGELCIIAAFWLLLISLTAGASIYKQDNTELLMEKQTIEYVLENKPDYYIFEKAKEYNHEVNNGNNYFCRFNIEDRSEFEININKYLEGER